MNIDVNAAQKSAVACWRKLLRALDQLPSINTVGADNMDLAFVAAGVKSQQGLQSFFAFLTSDLNLDIETRQEVLCSNIDDMVALGLLSALPPDVFTRTQNTEITKQLIKAQRAVRDAQDQYLDCSDDDDSDDDWMIGSLYHDSMVEAMEEVEDLKTKEFSIHIEYDAYLSWVCSSLVKESRKQCELTIQAIGDTPSIFEVEAVPFAQRISNRSRESDDPGMKMALK